MPEVVSQTGIENVIDWLVTYGYTMVMLPDGRNMAFSEFRSECDLSDRTNYDVRDVIIQRTGQGFTPISVNAVKVSPVSMGLEAKRGSWLAIGDKEGGQLAQLNITGYGDWKVLKPNGEPLPEVLKRAFI